MRRPNGAVFSSMIRAPSSALPLCTRAVGVAAARVAHHRHVVAGERGGTDPQERGHESAPKHCRTVDGDDLRADQRHCFVDAVVNHQSGCRLQQRRDPFGSGRLCWGRRTAAAW